MSAGQTVALFLDADSYYKKHPQSNKKDRSSHNLPLLYITNDYELDITYKLYYTKHIRSLASRVASDTGLDSFQLPSPFFIAIKFSK